MSALFGLRARLTAVVTVVFGVALSVTSVLVLNAVEDDLVSDTRASAETVLSSYLESIYGGTATLGVVDPAATTRFFYLDADGREISEAQYVEAIVGDLDEEFADTTSLSGAFVTQGGFVASANGDEVVVVDAETGEVLDAGGEVVSFNIGPQPVGQPRRVEVGAGVIGVAQTLEFSDGATIQVGVSSPLEPVTDSLDAFRRLVWLAVPILVALIAAITWLAATRTLAPVNAITDRARAITSNNIADRVPVPTTNDEIGRLARTVNDMLARLESSQERQRRLVADASHELRSPVAVSRAQLEVAAANPEAADWEATAEAVLAEQEHLGGLIDDLLAIARLDETSRAIVHDVDLDHLVAAEAGRPHLMPVRTSIARPVRVTGDPALLARAIRNLVDNATRHAASEVVISVYTFEGDAVIDVGDDGPGIPADERDRIFDRFSRVDEARDRDRGGAGLGLAIAREVATAHGGTLSVSASPLGGACFTLAIPHDGG